MEFVKHEFDRVISIKSCVFVCFCLCIIIYLYKLIFVCVFSDAKIHPEIVRMGKQQIISQGKLIAELISDT